MIITAFFACFQLSEPFHLDTSDTVGEFSVNSHYLHIGQIDGNDSTSALQFSEYGENIDRQEWVKDYGFDRSWTVSIHLVDGWPIFTAPPTEEQDFVPGFTFLQTAGNVVSLKLNGDNCELFFNGESRRLLSEQPQRCTVDPNDRLSVAFDALTFQFTIFINGTKVGDTNSIAAPDNLTTERLAFGERIVRDDQLYPTTSLKLDQLVLVPERISSDELSDLSNTFRQNNTELNRVVNELGGVLFPLGENRAPNVLDHDLLRLGKVINIAGLSESEVYVAY